jgi:hypothetical protein
MVSRIGQSLQGADPGTIAQTIVAIAQGKEVPGLPEEVNQAIKEEVEAQNPNIAVASDELTANLPNEFKEKLQNLADEIKEQSPIQLDEDGINISAPAPFQGKGKAPIER